MAYVEKCGKSFCVKQGNTGKTLSKFKNRKDATMEMQRLHRKNKPSAKNKGKSARKRNK